MRVDTHSAVIHQAKNAVLSRMPNRANRQVEQFVGVLRARTGYAMLGLSGIDRASAMLVPLGLSEDAEPQVLVTLPIFRLFSREARVGILAHEFAHAARASRFGSGWYKKMLSQYAREEKLADALAVRWGFGENLRIMHRERNETVNPLIDARVPNIVRRITKNLDGVELPQEGVSG
jgi:hypothetical protein